MIWTEDLKALTYALDVLKSITAGLEDHKECDNEDIAATLTYADLRLALAAIKKIEKVI